MDLRFCWLLDKNFRGQGKVIWHTSTIIDFSNMVMQAESSATDQIIADTGMVQLAILLN